mmetsp:Transcript_122932/g.244540  ORF Transcript_122932/g.244540 Transcript_122932/m.244540 type:complete len:150 (+) Transcript_122932:43-492(+)
MLQNNPPNAGSFRYRTGITLLVSGLAEGVRKTDLQGAFGDFGQILRIDLAPGKAYVEFEDERDAQDAISEMDGKKIKDRKVKVERTQARAVSPNTPRHGAKGIHSMDRSGGTLIQSRCADGPPLRRPPDPGRRDRSRSPGRRHRDRGED